MPQPCSICVHDRRREIEKALVGGTSYRNIAERFGTSLGALNRHRSHVSATLRKAHDRREQSRGESLLDQAQGLQTKTQKILDDALANGAPKLALWAIREARDNIKLLGESLGQLKGGGVSVAVGIWGNGQKIGAERNVCERCGQVVDWDEQRRRYIESVREALGCGPEGQDRQPSVGELPAGVDPES